MIELTPEQVQALDAPEQPPVAVDPRTGQEYLLIRREIYELVRRTLKPYGRGWDDPADDDLIRKDARGAETSSISTGLSATSPAPKCVRPSWCRRISSTV
jgi:hypothetical protein